MKKLPLTIVGNYHGGEMMVHWPNGKVEFLGFWACLRIAWYAIRHDIEIVVVDPKEPS